MPVPTAFSDLSTTAASNSPAGSDNVFPDLDNYLRAHAAMLASIYANSGNGWTSPYATAASPTFTGVASFPDGSASAPSITNTGDTNTGLFFPAADAVGIGVSGSEILRVTAEGVGIGTGSGTLNGNFQVRLDNAGAVNHAIVQNNHAAAGATARVAFGGYRDIDVNNLIAYVQAVAAEGTINGADAMGGRLQFGTTADGASGVVTHVELDQNGNLIPIIKASAPTLTTAGQMVFNLTSDTNLRISVRGSDGTTRVANITLA